MLDINNCKTIDGDEYNSFFQKSSHLFSNEFFYSIDHIEYSDLYFEKVQKRSFAVINKDGTALAFVPIASVNDRDITFYEKPLKVFYNTEFNLSTDERKQLDKFIFKHIQSIAVENNLSHIRTTFNSTLGSSIFKPGDDFEAEIEGIIDLSLSEDLILKSVRKSYRSLINWGKRNLELRIMNKDSGDFNRFEEFRMFHLEVSGKETRSIESWKKQFELITKGKAFLVLAYLDEKLVSANYTTHGCEEAYYSVGVNDRDLMAKRVAIGQFPLLTSILEAKRIGIKTFNLGYLGPSFPNEKDRNIALFKKGFCSSYRLKNILNSKL
tara:strand:- start:10443 stop:11414 length:972 start_codon:yes stop_codon:yes gene_type:complete